MYCSHIGPMGPPRHRRRVSSGSEWRAETHRTNKIRTNNMYPKTVCFDARNLRGRRNLRSARTRFRRSTCLSSTFGMRSRSRFGSKRSSRSWFSSKHELPHQVWFQTCALEVWLPRFVATRRLAPHMSSHSRFGTSIALQLKL